MFLFYLGLRQKSAKSLREQFTHAVKLIYGYGCIKLGAVV